MIDPDRLSSDTPDYIAYAFAYGVAFAYRTTTTGPPAMKMDPLKYAAHQALDAMSKRQPTRDITAELAAIQRRNRQDAVIAICSTLFLVLVTASAAMFIPH